MALALRVRLGLAHAKTGGRLAGYTVDGVIPTLVLDFCAGFYGTREIDGSDYRVDGVGAKLVLDFPNNFFGTEA